MQFEAYSEFEAFSEERKENLGLILVLVRNLGLSFSSNFVIIEKRNCIQT